MRMEEIKKLSSFDHSYLEYILRIGRADFHMIAFTFIQIPLAVYDTFFTTTRNDFFTC